MHQNIFIKTQKNIHTNNNQIIINHSNDKNFTKGHNLDRTIIVGPSFCAKTYLLLIKLKLIRLCDKQTSTHRN